MSSERLLNIEEEEKGSVILGGLQVERQTPADNETGQVTLVDGQNKVLKYGNEVFLPCYNAMVIKGLK
jgi:hypothetical protein